MLGRPWFPRKDTAYGRNGSRAKAVVSTSGLPSLMSVMQDIYLNLGRVRLVLRLPKSTT